jgi:hypothetical protein
MITFYRVGDKNKKLVYLFEEMIKKLEKEK